MGAPPVATASVVASATTAMAPRLASGTTGAASSSAIASPPRSTARTGFASSEGKSTVTSPADCATGA